MLNDDSLGEELGEIEFSMDENKFKLILFKNDEEKEFPIRFSLIMNDRSILFHCSLDRDLNLLVTGVSKDVFSLMFDNCGGVENVDKKDIITEYKNVSGISISNNSFDNCALAHCLHGVK